MDFENIYKSRRVILEMLQMRGYDTSKYEQQTREELNILFQQHGSKGNSEIDTLDIDISPRMEILEVSEPPERKPGVKVDDVESLVDKLKNEAKVL